MAVRRDVGYWSATLIFDEHSFENEGLRVCDKCKFKRISSIWSQELKGSHGH